MSSRAAFRRGSRRRRRDHLKDGRRVGSVTNAREDVDTHDATATATSQQARDIDCWSAATRHTASAPGAPSTPPGGRDHPGSYAERSEIMITTAHRPNRVFRVYAPSRTIPWGRRDRRAGVRGARHARCASAPLTIPSAWILLSVAAGSRRGPHRLGWPDLPVISGHLANIGQCSATGRSSLVISTILNVLNV
jgi:hypothetical protein